MLLIAVLCWLWVGIHAQMKGMRHDSESSEEDERTLERQRRMLILGKQTGRKALFLSMPHALTSCPRCQSQAEVYQTKGLLSKHTHIHHPLLQPATN